MWLGSSLLNAVQILISFEPMVRCSRVGHEDFPHAEFFEVFAKFLEAAFVLEAPAPQTHLRKASVSVFISSFLEKRCRRVTSNVECKIFVLTLTFRLRYTNIWR